MTETAARSGRRLLAWGAAVPVVLLGLAFGVLAGYRMMVHDQVRPGTRIVGLPVGGMDEAELRVVVAGSLREKIERPVILEVGKLGTQQVSPADVGIRLDQEATVQNLLKAGPGDLFAPIRAAFGSHTEAEPVIVADAEAGRAALTEQLARYQRRARAAELTTPTPEPVLLDKGTTSYSAQAADVDYRAAVSGRSVDAGQAFTAVEAAVRQRTGRARVPVEVTRIGAAGMGKVDQLIGTFTTEYPCCAPRVTNIHRMAEIVDGTVVAPGKTFSLNAKSGRRTLEGGFVNAPAIADGELVDQIGGGVSQFSTTLFNAVWFAGLDPIAHQPHSKYISRYPPGREATLDYDTIQNIFRNTTDAPVVIRTATTSTSVTVGLYGHTGDRTVTSISGPEIPRNGGGFSISVTREVQDDGRSVSTDQIGWAYTGFD